MRTIREETRGNLVLRLLETKGGYSGTIIEKTGGRLALLEGSDPVDLWQRLEQEAARSSKDYIGFDGAIARFLQFFPSGFSTPRYAIDERTYKVRAKSRLDTAAPLEAALHASGLGEAALTAFRDTNLLSQFEMMRVQDLLRSPSADQFVRSAARFARGGGLAALAEMVGFARPHDCAKWTVLTYLPFLWRPEMHMFLKPEVTKDFATRVGHPFIHAYTSEVSMNVYGSLLDLATQTERQIAALNPQDRIDVQSFIWVVGAYT